MFDADDLCIYYFQIPKPQEFKSWQSNNCKTCTDSNTLTTSNTYNNDITTTNSKRNNEGGRHVYSPLGCQAAEATTLRHKHTATNLCLTTSKSNP
jgi:hypothetical protein